ncbi:type IV secretion system protein [Phenylobacterium sp.]|uniref:type IV secretion system protein n=1 Tax=Phenylobacterium sp. TaxID=1871053 RepID=UPI00286BCC4A|nr:type IV secretion system protein [Phenylobacterium sp.]
MAGFCPVPDTDAGLVQGLLTSVDCNVLGMVETGYATLARPDSPVAAALTILLTLYVAVLGFRLMIGRSPLRIGDLTLTFLKIGVVLALATNWPTYQQLVFDTLFRGPEQLASGMMEAIQPAGSIFRRNPFDALQIAYDEMQRSAAFFAQRVVGQVSPLQGGTGFGALALNVSALTLLMTSLGAVLTAKIVLGMLLALGPVFVAFLLFDATRGLFEGWLRASVAFAIAPLLGILGLVGQLTLIEPHLIRLADQRGQGVVDLAPAIAIFMLCLVFAAVALAGALAVGVIATGFKLPWRDPAVAPDPGRRDASPATASALIAGAPDRRSGFEPPSRAATVVAAAAALDRRDSRALEDVAGPRRAVNASRLGETASETRLVSPISQTYRRSAQPRRAASSLRRDT